MADDVPEKWWALPNAAAYFGQLLFRHILALHVQAERGEERSHHIFSGFLVTYESYCFWVTAGHVVTEIKKALDDGEFTSLRGRWVDTFIPPNAGRSPGTQTIPVELKDLDMYALDDDEGGIDFGIVILRSAYARPIDANPETHFLTTNSWRNNHLSNPDGFYLVGCPTESFTSRIVSSTPNSVLEAMILKRVCLPLELIPVSEHGAADTFWGREHCRYFRIVDPPDASPRPVENIVGMSGGPIFSIEIEGVGFRIRLVAIQSMWRSQERVLRATSIEYFADIFEKGLRWALDQVGEEIPPRRSSS